VRKAGKPEKVGKVDEFGLNPKQRRFALEYLVDLNATQAARRAGYSVATAKQQGTRLLSHASVRRFLEPRLRKAEAKLELQAERLDLELARIAFVDPGRLADATGRRLELHELDEDTRRAIAGVKIRIAKVVHGKAAQALGDDLGVSDAARGRGVPWDGPEELTARPVEEVTLGTVEVKLSPKVEAIGLGYRRLGLLKDRLEVTQKLSHEQLLVLAQRIRERKLAAARAGAAVGGKPRAAAGGRT
jgi:phage terminase small subunit